MLSLREFRRPHLFKTWGFGLSGSGKSTKNDTKIDQQLYHHGPGLSKGYPQNQQTYEKVEKMQTQRTQIRNNSLFETRGDFLKTCKAQRIDVYRGIMKASDTKVVYKIAHREKKTNKMEMSQSPSSKLPFKNQ